MGKKKKENKSRYDILFGTPERAAQTIAFVTHKCYFSLTEFCDGCPLYEPCQRNAKKTLEWLDSPSKEGPK